MVRVSLPPAQLTSIPWGVGRTLSLSPGLGKSLRRRAGSPFLPLCSPSQHLAWHLAFSSGQVGRVRASTPAPRWEVFRGRANSQSPGEDLPIEWLGAGPGEQDSTFRGGPNRGSRVGLLVPLPGWHLGPRAQPSHLSLLPPPSHLPKAACCLRNLCFCRLGQNARPIQLCSAGLSGTALCPHAPVPSPARGCPLAPAASASEGVGWADFPGGLRVQA